jgi:hypothetical protein
MSVNDPALEVGVSWFSKTGSGLKNTWIEAHVVEAKQSGSNIVLTYIDSTGHERTIWDYGRNGLRQEVLSYLQAASPIRKVFLVTYDPKRPIEAKLASDTMLLSQHRRHWT